MGQALADIAHMRLLVVLNVGDNCIASLPGRCLSGQAGSLKALVANNNKLTDADVAAIGQLQLLNSLVLSHNAIRAFPPAVLALRDLTKLSLSHNAIRALPDSLAALHHLAELRLNDNQIAELPPGCLPSSLRLLDVGNNKLSDWEATLAGLAGEVRLGQA